MLSEKLFEMHFLRYYVFELETKYQECQQVNGKKWIYIVCQNKVYISEFCGSD